MKIILLSIGKTDDGEIRGILDKYIKRLAHYLPFEYTEIPDLKNTKNLSEREQKKQEGELIFKQLQPSDHLVLLDDKGKEFSSVAFSQYLEQKSATGIRRIVFVIGGPYGFSDEIYARANEKISLSRMTFTHQMVRIIFVEQLYRAMTILNHEPYHHE